MLMCLQCNHHPVRWPLVWVRPVKARLQRTGVPFVCARSGHDFRMGVCNSPSHHRHPTTVCTHAAAWHLRLEIASIMAAQPPKRCCMLVFEVSPFIDPNSDTSVFIYTFFIVASWRLGRVRRHDHRKHVLLHFGVQPAHQRIECVQRHKHNVLTSLAHDFGESSVPMTFVLPLWHQSRWACAAIPIDNHGCSINVSTQPSDVSVCELTCASRFSLCASRCELTVAAGHCTT